MVWNGSDRTHDIGQERDCDTSVSGPPPVRTDDGDNVDGDVDCGGDEDCDTSVPGTHAGCYSRSTATTVMTSLTTTVMVVGATDRLTTVVGTYDDDSVDDGGDCGDDEDCDPSVPGTDTGCHSWSTVATVMTSLTIGRRGWVASGLSTLVGRWLSVGHDK